MCLLQIQFVSAKKSDFASLWLILIPQVKQAVSAKGHFCCRTIPTLALLPVLRVVNNHSP